MSADQVKLECLRLAQGVAARDPDVDILEVAKKFYAWVTEPVTAAP